MLSWNRKGDTWMDIFYYLCGGERNPWYVEKSAEASTCFFFFYPGSVCELWRVEGIMKSKGLGLTPQPGSDICVYSEKKNGACSAHITSQFLEKKQPLSI